MHKAHPVPDSPVIKVVEVDGFVLDHTNPESHDTELGKIQAMLLIATGPLMFVA